MNFKLFMTWLHINVFWWVQPLLYFEKEGLGNCNTTTSFGHQYMMPQSRSCYTIKVKLRIRKKRAERMWIFLKRLYVLHNRVWEKCLLYGILLKTFDFINETASRSIVCCFFVCKACSVDALFGYKSPLKEHHNFSIYNNYTKP